MSACNFWGRSPHVLDFEWTDTNVQKLLPGLEQVREERHPQCKLSSNTAFIETIILHTQRTA